MLHWSLLLSYVQHVFQCSNNQMSILKRIASKYPKPEKHKIKENKQNTNKILSWLADWNKSIFRRLFQPYWPQWFCVYKQTPNLRLYIHLQRIHTPINEPRVRKTNNTTLNILGVMTVFFFDRKLQNNAPPTPFVQKLKYTSRGHGSWVHRLANRCWLSHKSEFTTWLFCLQTTTLLRTAAA